MIIEPATNTEASPATAIQRERHAARLPGNTGAGAEKIEKNQEAEK